jgi:transposase
VPGIGRVLAFTSGAEIGDIHRFASPKKLCGYSGLCPLSAAGSHAEARAAAPGWRG